MASEFALAAEILGVGKEILNPSGTITDLPEIVAMTGLALPHGVRHSVGESRGHK